MATNFIGPYQIDIEYQTGDPAFDHVVKFDCDVVSEPNPGDTFADFDLATRQGTGIQADTAMDALVAVLEPFFASADASIISATLWKVAVPTNVRTFKATYAIGAAGTAGGTTKIAGEVVFTFRTIEGGIKRVQLEETVESAQTRVAYGTLSPGIEVDLMDYVTDADTWILGRDTSYVYLPLNFCGGQNEAIWRKRYRD